MRRFIKFGTVGVFNTLITIVSYSILVAVGVNYLLANIISYGIGVINSYYWNKKWVFKSTDKSFTLIWKFLFVNLITLAINTCSLFILVDYFQTNLIIGQVISIGIGMMFNYFLNKKWTFNKDGGNKLV